MPSLWLRSLFWFALLGSLTSTIFLGLALTAALRFARKKRAVRRQGSDFSPPVSILKPLHGAEPGLRESLLSFFTLDYSAPYEILFCARREDDAGLQLAREIAAAFPERSVRFLACGEPQFPNPKMYSLAVMAEAAAYPHLVTSDADARVRPDLLRRCMQSLAPGHLSGDKPTDAAFCLYAGHVDRGGLFTHLDAAGKSVEMASGALVADMLSGTDFTLGVTVAMKREAFLRAGGYEFLGSHWAEDFVLGNRLDAAGRGVEISTEVIRIVVADQGIGRSLRDQLRWMQSTRRSRPWGHLGTGLTFAVPFGLLGCAAGFLLGHPVAAIGCLAAALVNRWLQAAVLLWVLESGQALLHTAIYPLRDLLGFMIWCCSYLPADTRYHGTRFRIMADGRLQEEPTSPATR